MLSIFVVYLLLLYYVYMRKLNYILIFALSICIFQKAEALDIRYSTIIGIKDPNILISYNSIGKKENFLCNANTHSCSKTNKTYLSGGAGSLLSSILQKELDDKKAGHITLSPSKNLVAYYVGGSDEKPTRIFTVRDIKTDNEYTISNSVSYWDLVNDEGRVFDFSPNSKSLAYLDDRDGALAMYLVDTTKISDTQITSTKLTTSAYQVDDFIFGDNQSIYYVGNSKDNPYKWSLYRYDIKTGKDKIVDTMVSYTDQLVKVKGGIIFNHLQKNGYSPKIYNMSNKKLYQFKTPYTDINKIIVNQEVVKFGQVHGILMKPKKEKLPRAYPLVIWLHGGPYRQTSYGYHPYHSYGTYDSILELLRKDGVVVLKLDYRGSFGFGRPYAEGIKSGVGKTDVEDVMDAITYAKSRYSIKDVYLAGNSYGGYMSLRALVEHPDSFTGVISINGVTDWEGLLDKMQTSIFNTEFGGLPDANNRTLYDQASIMNKTSNIGNQKIKIIAGEADRTIPLWQATTLYDKLKAEKKDVTLVTYPNEGHVYKEKKTITDLCNQMFNFVGIKVDKECKS